RPPSPRALHRVRGPRQRREHRQPGDPGPAPDHPGRVLLHRAGRLPPGVRRAQRGGHVRGRGPGRGHGRHPARDAAPGLRGRAMQLRPLGRTGLLVSEVGYGAWGIGGALWIGARDDESLRALHRAVDLGVNFIGTALGYGMGHSEGLVGRLLRERRETVYVATKVPPKDFVWPAQRGVPVSHCYPPEHIVSCCEKSLRNLGADHVDVLQLHTWQDEYLEQDGWKDALLGLKRSGKARFVGISVNDHDPASAMRAVTSGLFDTAQIIYTVFDQTPEAECFPACIERGVGVLARVPFDEGGLTGSITP